MEAKKAKYNGIGFRFDVYAWYFTTQRLAVDLDGIKDVDNETLFYTLLFGAHDSYCKHSIFKRNKYTFEKFVEKIDALKYGQIKELQSIIKSSIKSDGEQPELKKKHPNGMS